MKMAFENESLNPANMTMVRLNCTFYSQSLNKSNYYVNNLEKRTMSQNL